VSSLRSRCFTAAFLAACGGGDGDDGLEGTPILEIPPRIARACDLVSPATIISDGQVVDFTLFAADGRHHALMNRSDQSVTLAELELEPVSLGAPVWSTSAPVFATNASIAARESPGLGLAWSEVDGQTGADFSVAVAIVDDTGAMVGALTRLPTDGDVRSVSLVARPGGFALAWSEQSKLQFVSLDPAGVPAGPALTIATGTMFGAHMVRHGDGYAIAWSTMAAAQWDVHVVLLDAGGAPRTEPRRLSARDDRSHYAPFVASVGADVLVAWEENYFAPVNDMGGHTIVRVARVTDAGDVVEPIRHVQDPEPGIVNVNPTLLAVPGALALSWSRGHYISVCGGCVTDNTMQLVQLDPADLAPISEIVEITADAGLRSAPIVSADGNDFAYLMAIDRHASFDLASALVRCGPS
jgi:hypothetical protein